LFSARTRGRRVTLKAFEMGGERACHRMNVARVWTTAPAVGGGGGRRRHLTTAPLSPPAVSTGGSGLGGSGIGSATSATSSIGLVSSLGGGVGSLCSSGGPGARSLGGVEGAAGTSGSSSMTTGAPASKSDASRDSSRLKAAMPWAATTTTKHAIQRTASARSTRNSRSAALKSGTPRRGRDACAWDHSAAGAAAG
jgi:hypothetical protein